MANIQPPMEHFERPDPVLTNKIVTHLKSQGIFDQFRRECMADVDTKPAYHNLRQRVEGQVAAFLRLNPWRPDMNKNQLRDNLRKHIQSGGFLDIGVDRIVDQVVNPKIYTVFLPKVEEVVQSCLGMENDKPKFEPPLTTEIKSEPPKFQDKHNLAPRAKLPAPLMGPMIKPLKPPDQEEEKSSVAEEKLTDTGGETDTEEANDKKYVVDEDDLEVKEEEEDDDDEESPPFEPHSEGDRLILGTRSDSSENSNDSQVVTTIVDDSLEERIDHNEVAIKEESDKKDEDSSSDEYVPKTPTINMEESDGTVLEFNSISEYKQYQTKFEEESFGNVEEVVASHDNREPVKEEKSNEEDSVSGLHKRKFNSDSYDDVSNSSSERESSDEIKPAVFESFSKKRYKLEEYDHDNETSELSMNEAENEDYYSEKSLDISDSKLKILDNEPLENPKGSSTSSKESEKKYHNHHKEHRESSSSHSSKDRTVEKEYPEKNRSSHSSKDKKDNHKKSEKHESSRDQNKDRDRKRSESSTKHGEKGGPSKHSDKGKERDKEKKRSKSSERSKKDKEDVSKYKKESKHDHKDHHREGRSKTDYDKEKKKHHNREKHSDGKEDLDSANKSDKEKKEDSKHSHSSSKHSHRSSSEKHKTDKDNKHKGSSDRHKSHDKKSDKESKDESRKKYRQHCKYNSDRDESRRSSDRDSSGPSERTQNSSSSKSRSSRTATESKVETGERTTSNSDNTVSDSVEVLQNDLKLDVTNEHGTASLSSHLVEDSCNESDVMQSDCDTSKDESDQHAFKQENLFFHGVDEVQEKGMNCIEKLDDEKDVENTSSFQIPASEKDNSIETDVFSPEKRVIDVNINSEYKQDSATPSILLHDSSSEKENIEQDIKEQITSEHDDNSTDASLDEDSTVVKFKKPKIAKNIHEVKKIMEARRHLKRMEKKRMKLLIKNNSEGYESDEKSPSENKSEDEYQDDVFRGFDDDLSLEKINKYACITERLENEASQLEKLIDTEQINTNLITSWIDLDPDFDTYIENTLKGKVHRIYKVQIPPICDEFYTYDSEENIYLLNQNWESNEQKNVLVDSNLNNLNSILPTDYQENSTPCNENSRKRKLGGRPVSFTNREILHGGFDCKKGSPPKRNLNDGNAHSDDEITMISEEGNVSNTSVVGRVASNVIAPQIKFSLTFNETYDEVLKEKAQNSVVPSKREMEELCKTPRTVVKITNNQTTEQVFVKKMQSNPEEKNQVPRITRSETIVNGKVLENFTGPKNIPFISRITKGKNASTPVPTKNNCQQTNGIISLGSTTNTKFEGGFPMAVSQKIINDVIGIQFISSDQGNISDQGSHSGEEVSEQKRRRTTGCRQQQRYDSSDLYKPRPQLSSRRVRALGSSPEGPPVVAQVVTRRKRSATSDLTSSLDKRRR